MSVDIVSKSYEVSLAVCFKFLIITIERVLIVEDHVKIDQGE